MRSRLTVLAAGILAVLAGTRSTTAQNQKETPWLKSFSVDPRDLSTVGENPYFILTPGFQLTLEGKEGTSTMRLVITVLNETKTVGGIETRVVEERELKDGAPIEVSRNYFAINTKTKDVYYFGEEVDMYKKGKITGHEGAWLHGSRGAAFGLMMPGTPVVGLRHFQEMAPEVAMDRAEVVSVTERFQNTLFKFEGCLKTRETTLLEMFAKEYKLYAPGVGLVREGSMELVAYGPSK